METPTHRGLFFCGDGDAHIAEAVPMMRTLPPTQRMSIAHHVNVAQAVALVLDASTATHRIYNLVDEEAPDIRSPANGSTSIRPLSRNRFSKVTFVGLLNLLQENWTKTS